MTDDTAHSPAGTWVWAEEGGIRLAIELRDGLVVCRIDETHNGIDFKPLATASVSYARWERLVAVAAKPRLP